MGKSYLLLRESRASRPYSCATCSAAIPRRSRYFRDEPHPYARMFRGEEVRHLCVHCVEGLEAKNISIEKRLLPTPRQSDQSQLTLPLGEAVVRPTIVQLIRVTHLLDHCYSLMKSYAVSCADSAPKSLRSSCWIVSLLWVWRRSRSDIGDPKTVVS